ncbi:MAG: di-heme oxidoredictase family protein [Bacteroidota bacterium]
MSRTLNTIIPVIVLSLFLGACAKLLPGQPEDDQLLDGPVAGLSAEQYRVFLAGDVAFNDEIFTAENGLGPLFVSNSCGSCHAGDGKGHPFTTLTRFGQVDSTGNLFLNRGGPQLQHRAISGYQPEQLPSGATFSRFTPPANTGLGFLEALTDAQLLAHADPYDLDGDGISGRPNYIDPPAYFIPGTGHIAVNGRYIGRFGKKAGAIDLLHQTVNAYNQDMGITSLYSAIDTWSGKEVDPEISTAKLNSVVFYLQTLKEPVQRGQQDETVQAGKRIFSSTGCNKCHIEQWATPGTAIQALSNKTFFPYTDLLLHDMGSGLNDGYTEGMAEPSEWRTPPLWGLGLSANSQGGAYYLMHDGRARSIESAILLHGGEGLGSRSAYTALSGAEKQQLIKFLESL